MVERFKDTGHIVVQSAGALSRGILRRKNIRDTIHFNADALNTELQIRTIHLANQLSIYGAVSINEEILKSVNPQEVNSLERTPRNGALAKMSGAPVSGNGLQKCLRNFESLEKSIQFTKIREDASFCNRFSIGICYKTISDVDDGLRSNTSMLRAHTPSCRQRFQSSCHNCRKNHNWTSHSRSHNTTSWQSWTCNSDPIPDQARSKICGGNMRREESCELHLPNPGHNLTSSE